MARKINIKETRRPRTVVVGAGITEYWYLKHLKKLKGYRYALKPSLFGDESMQTVRKRILEGIQEGATVICLFDEDVRQWNEAEKKRMEEIHREYDDDDKIVIASSMPSIEYWLLLHFENTNRFFGTSNKVIETLRKYVPAFDKRESFLKQENWLLTLIRNQGMENAYTRAKTFGRAGQSFSDIWKAIDRFEERDV